VLEDKTADDILGVLIISSLLGFSNVLDIAAAAAVHELVRKYSVKTKDTRSAMINLSIIK
jgi:hypothetical protein